MAIQLVTKPEWEGQAVIGYRLTATRISSTTNKGAVLFQSELCANRLEASSAWVQYERKQRWFT